LLGRVAQIFSGEAQEQPVAPILVTAGARNLLTALDAFVVPTGKCRFVSKTTAATRKEMLLADVGYVSPTRTTS
jgi:hypothetical protein